MDLGRSWWRWRCGPDHGRTNASDSTICQSPAGCKAVAWWKILWQAPFRWELVIRFQTLVCLEWLRIFRIQSLLKEHLKNLSLIQVQLVLNIFILQTGSADTSRSYESFKRRFGTVWKLIRGLLTSFDAPGRCEKESCGEFVGKHSENGEVSKKTAKQTDRTSFCLGHCYFSEILGFLQAGMVELAWPRRSCSTKNNKHQIWATSTRFLATLFSTGVSLKRCNRL